MSDTDKLRQTDNTDNSIDLSVEFAGLKMSSPIIAASGTFGFGREFAEYIDLSILGGVSVKGLTLKPRLGNPPPRIAEARGGILNSVGLQNPGIEAFIRDEIPFLRRYDTLIIANLAGASYEEYVEGARLLSQADIDAIELNVSCPNVKEGCVAFGSDPEQLTRLVYQVRNALGDSKPLIVKLTPNVTSIVSTAKAAVNGGANALSLINTLLGMAIDARRMKPVLANVTGGVSGPCIKPVALRMVYEVCGELDVPVIGMGGIESGEDAAEFMLAGATAVQIGTANLVNPCAAVKITSELLEYMRDLNFTTPHDFIGRIRRS